MSVTLKDLRVQTQHNLLMTDAANPTRPASLADLVEVLKQEGAEIEWLCEYPEFADPNCYSGHPDPKPGETRQPRKHTQCGLRLVLPLGDTP